MRSKKLSPQMVKLLRRFVEWEARGAARGLALVPSLTGPEYATYWALRDRELIVNARVTDKGRAELAKRPEGT